MLYTEGLECLEHIQYLHWIVTVVFLASGQYTLSMRTYAPFRNVVRSNQRHDSGDEVKFKKL